MSNTHQATNQLRQRIAVSVFFFIHGTSFATWTSRIPDIKQTLSLNDAEIGMVLLVMPFSSLLGLFLAGWLNRNFDNKPPLVVAMLIQCSALVGIGLSSTVVQLAASLFCLSLAFRIGGIAMNTQAVLLQKLFTKPINGSFHAMWSVGGIIGVGLTTLLINFSIPMEVHLIGACIGLSMVIVVTFNFLPTGDKATAGSRIRFGKPDKSLVLLGMIIMCASFCEGGMFDWSGIYFKEVIHTDIYTVGYFTFMICMALSRWFMDKVVTRVGKSGLYFFSSTLIVSGIALTTLFPYIYPAMIGFSLVGIGTAAVVPTTFILAGESRKYSPGMAISIVSTYGILGMLIGPPVIGFLSHAYGMKLAFIFIAAMGLCIVLVSKLYFNANHPRT
ncbi:MAG: MFS transporter [Cyclobacteriaceae bacterium]